MKYLLFLFSLLFLIACGNQAPVIQQADIQIPDTMTTEIKIPKPIENTESIEDCLVFDTFLQATDYKWGIVNDGVMWGKSRWTAIIDDEKLIFSGTIITRWGGFSSLRAWLESWILTDYNSVKLRAKSDWREYRITLRDNQWGNISHRVIIPFQTPGEFEEITINFTDLEPAYFGRIVKADPFEKESAREIGVILSDWVDWEFELVIDEVRFCR